MRKLAALLALALLAACGTDGGGGGDRGGGDRGADGGDRGATPRSGDLRVVSLNLLHGAFCPTDTDACRAPERVALFLDQLEAAECPPVVALQEIDPRLLGVLRDEVPARCEGAYEIVWHGDEGIDRELVLTTYEVVDQRLMRLAGPLRSAYRVRLRAPIGEIVLVVTHLASSDNTPCSRRWCPPPCDLGARIRVCQARQVADLADEGDGRRRFTAVAGDLNDVATSDALGVFLDRGFVDTHLAAGNVECDPATGISCTSGRADQDLSDLTNRESRQSERIDYVLLRAPDDCQPVFDPDGDPDGDGVPTGVFAASPATGDLAFPSDHTAVALDVRCGGRGARP